MQTKGIFKSIGSLGSIMAIVTGLLGWYNELPPELIGDTQAWVALIVTGAISLYGRWKATVPLSVLKPFGGKVEILPK